jgi:hypothetical protein
MRRVVLVLGSGNVFGPNNCNTSVPARLCD